MQNIKGDSNKEGEIRRISEEKAPGELFRWRGNERSEAIGAAAPGQNPLQRAIGKRGSTRVEPFSFYAEY